MTPANHGTAATTLLSTTTSPGDHVTSLAFAHQALVHAILAGKAGTGTAYTNAEAELVLAATVTGTLANLTRAHAYALLAS